MTEDLIITTTRQVADILDRLQDTDRPRRNLAEDYKALEALSADVPALKESAGWLLDQIALRDVHAQRLRAVLEPDITDYQRDRDRSIDSADAGAPALDEERATQLSQARDVVRAYTAAAHSGREAEAQHLLDAFPVPARPLQTSGPAAAWRRNSPTAQDAVTALETQRAATTADDSSPYVAAPELLHATTAYLAAREGQLHHLHDALGRLAYPAQPSAILPTDLAPVAAAQTQRRVIDAFGTPERAHQALDGQISYQRRRPPHADRPTTAGTDTDADLLSRARAALEEIDGPGGSWTRSTSLPACSGPWRAPPPTAGAPADTTRRRPTRLTLKPRWPVTPPSEYSRDAALSTRPWPCCRRLPLSSGAARGISRRRPCCGRLRNSPGLSSRDSPGRDAP
ncbi:hypothetical protein ACFQ9Z_37695 [Streptomyces sp. NPDC056580]|uniref:hypothetical protein n=1 Tax=Streptomyces sp. NPDC056580 TaxID=3345872 RepID=UPI0036AA6958